MIAVGCPVRNRAWVLPEYLQALNDIKHDALQFLFLVNNSTDATEMVLHKWMSERSDGRYANIYRHDEMNPVGHARGEYGRDRYANLASVRNRFVDLFLTTEAQYLLSVDSDVIVPPDIITHLLRLADARTIVGAAISNIQCCELDGKLPGNFMTHQNGVLVHPPEYPLSGSMAVDVTGACVLIPRAILAAGARYAAHPQGEDIPFCATATALGASIVVTFDVRPHHRMVAL